MALKLPSRCTLPWIWVVEAISSSSQLETSLLIDLIKNIPVISDDLGKEAREVVSLRILESLVVQDNQNNNADASESRRIQFDPSDSCEDVLRHVLQEVSASNISKDGPKMLKWNLQSFIAIKKGCLPKFSLQKLKDAILESSLSVPAFLKERSGVAVTTHCDDSITGDDGNSVGLVNRKEESNKDIESVVTGNGAGQLEEIVTDKNSVTAKRKWTNITAENMDRQTCENQNLVEDLCDSHAEAGKKFKQYVNDDDHELVQNSVDLRAHGVQQNSLGGGVDDIEGEGYNLGKDTEVLCMDHNDEHLHSQMQAPNDGSSLATPHGEMPYQTNCGMEDNGCDEGFERRTPNGIAQVEEENNLKNVSKYFNPDIQPNATTVAEAAEAKIDTTCNGDLETTSDTDEYHDERTDIDSKKNAFLSSQCSYSQDSLATPVNHCLRCHKGGKLLVCSSDTCPLVVHEKCLGSDASFDATGKFYCPFCAYSRAISTYLEVKKNVSLARKELAIFIGSEIRGEPKFCTNSSRHEQNLLRGGDDLMGNNSNRSADCQNGGNCRNDKPNVDNQQEAGPCTDDGSPSEHNLMNITHTVPHLMGNLKGKNVEPKFQSPGRPEEDQADAQAIHKSLSCKEPKVSNRGRGRDQVRGKKKVSHESKSTLSLVPLSVPSTERSEEENDKSVTSQHSLRLRNSPRKYTCPAGPLLRRKPLPWTKEEEDKLKEGVQRLTSPHDQSMPWKQILEFGADIFHKGRTAIDLKDKWRNICKGGPKSE